MSSTSAREFLHTRFYFAHTALFRRLLRYQLAPHFLSATRRETPRARLCGPSTSKRTGYLWAMRQSTSSANRLHGSPRLVVDLFSGVGGCGVAISRAFAKRGERVQVKALNHWNLSCASYFTNHPEAMVFCERITRDRALEIVPDGYLDLLVSAPECTNHSQAKNGKPRDDQSRASPWLIVDWCSRLYVERFFLENVPEMKAWGPLDERGQPIPERAGACYQAWLAAMRAIGYEIVEVIVDGADFGDAQHRPRLFIMGVRGRKTPAIPFATHGEAGLLGLEPFRTARDIVDWNNMGKRVEAKRYLCPATRQRIQEGLDRFGGQPFLLPRVRHGRGAIRSIDRPLNTVTCTSWDIGLVTPKKDGLYHRSVTTRELLNSMSFPSDYQVLSPAEAAPVLSRLGLPLDCSLRSLPSIKSPVEFRTVQVGNAVCTRAVETFISALLAA